MRKTLSRFGQWFARHRQVVQATEAGGRRHRSAGRTWTGLEALEARAMLSAGPTIASVTANPTAVVRGSSITLTANNVVDTGAAVKSVVFYLDSNNDGVLDNGDHRLGAGKAVAGTANYSLTTGTHKFGVSSDSVTGGSVGNKVFAVATDAARNKGTAVSSNITIASTSPSITNLKLVNTPVLSAGNAMTLKALGVMAHDGAVITKVDFYYDSTGDGTLQIPASSGTTATTDTLLGTDSAWPGGWTLTTNAPTTLPSTGAVHFFAVVTDSDGTTSVPEPLIATVDALPTIGTLTSTPTGATRGTATTVTLTASTVADTDGTVKHVRFYFDSNNNGILDANDKLLAAPTKNGSTYTTTGSVPSTLTSGNATFFAVAEDDKGATSVVSTVQVPITPPSIGTFTASVPTVEDRGSPVTLTASNFGTLTGKTISSVQFFIDSNNNGKFDSADTSINTDTTVASDGSFSFIYTVPSTATTGPTTFFAIAKDSAGNLSPAVSVPVTIGPSIGSFTVTVTNGSATTPATTAAIGQAVTFAASNVVVASGKTVSQVQFYLDTNNNGVFDSGTDTLVGPATFNATTNTYSFTYTIANTIPTGNDTFLAVASDNSTTPVTSTAATVKLKVTPSIGSFTSGAPTVGVNKPFILTATNVVTSTNKTISTVQFFLDTNKNGTYDPGIDAIVGAGTLQAGGSYLLSLNNLPTNIPVGTDTFFAVATDSSGIASPASKITVSVAPSVGSLTTNIQAGLTAAPGQTITLTANSPLSSAGRSVTGVEFFLDVNNNNTVDTGIDMDLGPGTLQADGSYKINYTIPQNATNGMLTFLAVAKDGTITGLPANVTVNVVVPTGA